jgi:hypothetical protein
MISTCTPWSGCPTRVQLGRARFGNLNPPDNPAFRAGRLRLALAMTPHSPRSAMNFAVKAVPDRAQLSGRSKEGNCSSDVLGVAVAAWRETV